MNFTFPFIILRGFLFIRPLLMFGAGYGVEISLLVKKTYIGSYYEIGSEFMPEGFDYGYSYNYNRKGLRVLFPYYKKLSRRSSHTMPQKYRLECIGIGIAKIDYVCEEYEEKKDSYWSIELIGHRSSISFKILGLEIGLEAGFIINLVPPKYPTSGKFKILFGSGFIYDCALFIF